MKIKIVEKNWDGYTGALAGFSFVDGVSENDIDLYKALYIGGVIQIVDADTGLPVSELHEATLIKDIPLEASCETSPANIIEEAPIVEEEPVVEKIKIYTREELEAIADSSGIKGIRAIANQYNIKSTSIVELMEQILLEQNKA